MLNLFSTQKPTPSHTRSQTLEDVCGIYGGQHVTDTVTGFPGQSSASGLPAPILRQAVLAEPRRTHQRSLTECDPISHVQPPPSTSSGEQHQTQSPLTTGFDFGFAPPYKPPRQGSPARNSTRSNSPKLDTKVTKVASWFQGESEPIKVGFVPSPSKETFGISDNMSSPSTSKVDSVPPRTAPTMPSIRPAMASRFSFFSSKTPPGRSHALGADANDEFLSMDTNTALFPAGKPDPFSPAGFKNLQQQAEGLLTRLQNAYRERTQALRELTAEKEALDEETQGAETRARHLKLQLDKMAAKLAEQDGVMMNLVDELAQEKLARREEEEIRKRSIRLVEREARFPANATARMSHGRTSSSNTVSDSGFESEDDSCSAGSVFSRRNTMHSPTMSMSSVSTTNSPEHPHPSTDLSNQLNQAARLRASHASYKAGHQSRNALPTLEAVQPPLACTNCNGVSSTEAWSVVSILKEENQCLKHRIQELEGALDGALDMVGGLGG